MRNQDALEVIHLRRLQARHTLRIEKRRGENTKNDWLSRRENVVCTWGRLESNLDLFTCWYCSSSLNQALVSSSAFSDVQRTSAKSLFLVDSLSGDFPVLLGELLLLELKEGTLYCKSTCMSTFSLKTLQLFKSLELIWSCHSTIFPFKAAKLLVNFICPYVTFEMESLISLQMKIVSCFKIGVLNRGALLVNMCSSKNLRPQAFERMPAVEVNSDIELTWNTETSFSSFAFEAWRLCIVCLKFIPKTSSTRVFGLSSDLGKDPDPAESNCLWIQPQAFKYGHDTTLLSIVKWSTLIRHTSVSGRCSYQIYFAVLMMHKSYSKFFFRGLWRKYTEKFFTCLRKLDIWTTSHRISNSLSGSTFWNFIKDVISKYKNSFSDYPWSHCSRVKESTWSCLTYFVVQFVKQETLQILDTPWKNFLLAGFHLQVDDLESLNCAEQYSGKRFDPLPPSWFCRQAEVYSKIL